MKVGRLTLALFGVTALFATTTTPLVAQDGDPDQQAEPPPRIISVTPFSGKKAATNGCTLPGLGCVITLFEDGHLSIRTVRNN